MEGHKEEGWKYFNYVTSILRESRQIYTEILMGLTPNYYLQIHSLPFKRIHVFYILPAPVVQNQLCTIHIIKYAILVTPL